MNLWQNYKNHVKKVCSQENVPTSDLEYWRNDLFINMVTYLVAFCLMALIPSLYWTLTTHQYINSYIILSIYLILLSCAFFPKININHRKLFFTGTLQILCFFLLLRTGLFAPGFIYMQAVCTLTILIFSKKYAYYPTIINLFICVVISYFVYQKSLPWQKTQTISFGAWLVVCLNLLFLNFLSSALLPKLFDGLQQAITKEKEAALLLQQKQDSLKIAMQQLESKNLEIEQFAYVASHDLQEPLRMISSFMALLKKKYNNIIDEKGKSYIHYATDGANRMKLIMLDLLEFSKVGKSDDKLEEIDLNEILNETQLLLKRKILEKNALITYGAFPLIKSYKTPIKQLLNNLIENALKYSAKNKASEIKISLTETQNFWQFEISDNGIGIKEEYFETIFIMFKRLHSISDYEGTGMGLAICKKIVENLGGEIWLTSKIDVGTTFYFTIKK